MCIYLYIACIFFCMRARVVCLLRSQIKTNVIFLLEIAMQDYIFLHE